MKWKAIPMMALGIFCILCCLQFSQSTCFAAKACSICIGLTKLDPDAYGTNVTELSGCDNDADDIAKISGHELQCKPVVLKNEEATRTNVLSAIVDAEKQMSSNDIVFIYFSGHGSQIRDQSADAKNGMDQTWCLYDGQLLDKELYAQWSKFTNGVRIVVFSDSCHSEGISKLFMASLDEKFANDPASAQSEIQKLRFIDRVRAAILRRPIHVNVKALTLVESVLAYEKQKSIYEDIILKVFKPSPPINAQVLSISACLDDETAGDAGPFRNSVFTRALKQIWRNGAFSGDYSDFTLKIAELSNTIRRDQHATNRMIDIENPAFWGQHPFTLEQP